MVEVGRRDGSFLWDWVVEFGGGMDGFFLGKERERKGDGLLDLERESEGSEFELLDSNT